VCVRVRVCMCVCVCVRVCDLIEGGTIELGDTCVCVRVRMAVRKRERE